MSKLLLQIGLIIGCLSGFATSRALADGTQTTVTSESSQDTAREVSEDVYAQVLSLSAGSFAPRSAVISSGSSTFSYDRAATQTFLLEAGWAARLFNVGGNAYLSEGLAFTRFSGSPSRVYSSANTAALSANLIGLDTRLQYALEDLPLGWFIPYVDGGYQLTFYTQTGSTDIDSAEGTTGNFVAGAGARFWLNRALSINSDFNGTYKRIPIFFNVKFNRIFPNNRGLDLADSSVLAGIGVGL